MFARNGYSNVVWCITKPFQIRKLLRKSNNQGTRILPVLILVSVDRFFHKDPIIRRLKTFSPWRENMVRIGSFWPTMSQILCQQITWLRTIPLQHLCFLVPDLGFVNAFGEPKEASENLSQNVIEDSIMVLLEDNSKVKAFDRVENRCQKNWMKVYPRRADAGCQDPKPILFGMVNIHMRYGLIASGMKTQTVSASSKVQQGWYPATLKLPSSLRCVIRFSSSNSVGLYRLL